MGKDYPVIPVSGELAIGLINELVMVDGAWRTHVGRMPPTEDGDEERDLEVAEQIALLVVAAWTYTHDSDLATGDLLKVVGEFIDRKRDATMEVLRNLEGAGLVRNMPNPDRGNVWLWTLKDFDVRRRLERLMEARAEIRQVVAAQVANPEDENAGRELLTDDSYYYNVVQKRNERRADKQ